MNSRNSVQRVMGKRTSRSVELPVNSALESTAGDASRREVCVDKVDENIEYP